MNFKDEKEAIKWVQHHCPVLVHPMRNSKRKAIYPFVSAHAERIVHETLGKELFKHLNNE